MDNSSNLHGYLTSMEGAVCAPVQLIELIKLLGAGNPVLNQLYLKLVETTVCRCYETQLQLEECRHLIWLIFRHPAFSAAERATLLHWVDIFDRIFPTHYESESGYSSGGSDRSSSCSPSPTQDKMFVYNPNFLFQLPPPAALAAGSAALPPHCRRNNMFKRSQSEPCGVNPPGGNFVGTRCKVQHRERAIDITTEMTALMSWLKTLRLHKYYPKLSTMTYDAMLKLNEESLSDITEGARRKILLNIQKLGGRHGLLTDIATDLSKPGRFNSCITELHNMLMKTPFRLPPSSPLAPSPDPDYETPETDLIIVFTSVLETAGNIILANNIEEDCQKLFFKLLEDAGQHAAFPEKQRRLVCGILEQCIDNYNYRNGQVIQLKRWDLTNFPHSVKIKYPIKPVNGMNHQSNGSYGGYNKFNRPAKPTWQQGRSPSGNGHLPLHQSTSLPAPVAPPAFSPFANSIWSSPSSSACSFGGGPASLAVGDPGATRIPDNLDYVGLESLCSQIAECALAEK